MAHDKEDHDADILIVDDDAIIRATLARLLSEVAGTIVTAATSEQAITELECHHFDIVVTDVMMPGSGGMDLASWIKRSHPFTDVLVMTGCESIDKAAAALRLGACDHLLKPFPNEDLVIASVERAIQMRRLEAQFRQAQKLEQIGRFVGGIAHDFNNVLTVISLLTCSILDETPHGDARREDITEVLHAADRAAELTRQLLEFSRPQPIAPKVASLNDIVTAVDRMLRRIIGEDIELVVSLQEYPWSVLVDPGQIEQIVMNLAVNARDAMPRGGKLVIETANGESADPDIGDYVLLRTMDTGSGMDEEVKANLFKPFFTTKATGSGTGLGLATVHAIVKNAGGDIQVESEPGKGAMFEIRLPRAPIDRGVHATAPAPVFTADVNRLPLAV